MKACRNFFAPVALVATIGFGMNSYANEEPEELSFQVNDTLIVLSEVANPSTGTNETVVTLYHGPSVLEITQVDSNGFVVAGIGTWSQYVAWEELEDAELDAGDSDQRIAFEDFKTFVAIYGLFDGYRSVCDIPIVGGKLCHEHCKSIPGREGGYCDDGVCICYRE